MNVETDDGDDGDDGDPVTWISHAPLTSNLESRILNLESPSGLGFQAMYMSLVGES